MKTLQYLLETHLLPRFAWGALEKKCPDIKVQTGPHYEFKDWKVASTWGGGGQAIVLQQVAYADTRPNILLACSHLQLYCKTSMPFIVSGVVSFRQPTSSHSRRLLSNLSWRRTIIMGSSRNAPISMMWGGTKAICRSLVWTNVFLSLCGQSI